MKYITLLARIVLGAGFMTFGLNFFFHFLPLPPYASGSMAETFFTVMGPSHWINLVAGFQVVGGALVLSGCMAPLGLCLLAPVLVNILAFHVFLLDGEGMAPGVVLSVFEAFLLYAYRGHLLPLFTTRAKAQL